MDRQDDKKDQDFPVGFVQQLRHLVANKDDLNFLLKNKKLLHRLAQLTNIDHLTHAFNRLYFDEGLKKYVYLARRYHHQFALLLLDIDHFKTINDTLGHDMGDRVLRFVANKIKRMIRRDDMIARLGGDEFVIILNQITRFTDAGKVAQKILNLFSRPIHLRKQEVYIRMSMGIACYPEAGENCEELLQNVDVALYRVKQTGRNNYHYYRENLDKIHKRFLHIESSIQTSISRNEFSLMYQPILDLKTQKVVHFEALLRWTHAELGVLSPAEFIPIAESTGKVALLTQWVIEAVAKQLSAWKQDKRKLFPIAINISTVDLWYSNSIRHFFEIIQHYHLPPKLFQMEVTETTIMQREEAAIIGLKKLRDFGIHVAIDDFGTGYSSLGRLHNLPVYAIKIDRSFIAALPDDQRMLTIVNSIILLAKHMNFKIIAEGVETLQQAHLLKKLGCDYAQGYYFYRPLSVTDTEGLLQS